MENIHDYINSILIVIVGIIILVQKKTISFMVKTIAAIDIDVDKIIASKQIIIESIQEQHKIELEKERLLIAKEVFSGYQKSNSVISDKHHEILIFLVQVLYESNIDKQKLLLNKLPKNRGDLSTLLLKYQAGILSGESKHL